MKKGLSEIICIIDKSGSMGSIVNDAIGGFNVFLDEQKKFPGEATLTYIQFDTKYQIIHENKPIQEVQSINNDIYRPGGCTALLDAVGETIDRVGNRLKNTSEDQRPEKVIVAILTDGEENSSIKYSLGRVKEMITHQKEVYQWEFIYLGANQDAFLEASNLGISKINTSNFMATAAGIKKAYKSMSNTVYGYRAK